MPFQETLSRYAGFDFPGFISSVTVAQAEKAMGRDRLSELDFLTLLSPAAAGLLEHMAQRASALTRQYFGNIIFMFTPLYISNFCDNRCPYCSFARQHAIARRQLSRDEIEAEAAAIASTGMRSILVLTGESRRHASPDYILNSVEIIRRHFATIGIEMYPMTSSEYSSLVNAGAEGLTMFQETYDETAYHGFHSGGPKDDFLFRLDAPQRAGQCGIRSLTVGSLLGLSAPRTEAFFAGLHATYLQKTFPAAEVSLSMPRLRPMVGEFLPHSAVDDRLFVQILCATRLFLPRMGITISTRESRAFRNSIVKLGVTKMSAGVSTAVGGHGESATSAPQFEIADTRSLVEMKSDLVTLGFQPVLYDWNAGLLSPAK
jgi:2-iminoacetate synthase